jgi:S1-C subfamily serine protease
MNLGTGNLGSWQFVSRTEDEHFKSTGAKGSPPRDDSELLDAYSQAVIGVVESAGPAVVSVTGLRQGRPAGTGSAFVIAPDGYAITNSHVVEGHDKFVAETVDGDRIAAELIGDDPATDLALLRLATNGLTHVELGDSDALRPGQLVIAVGSPLGLQSTVSTGVVSAIGRNMRGRDGRLIDKVIQHAAPINPGNSGGPLLDSRGRVVGVNTAIIAFAQGLGFAIPSNTAQWVVTEIFQHGRVRRRQLGITATTRRLPRQAVREWDLIADTVVEVMEVARNGAAETAGLRAGDFIAEINGRLVTDVDDLHRLLAAIPADAPLSVTVLRDSAPLELVVRAKD